MAVKEKEKITRLESHHSTVNHFPELIQLYAGQSDCIEITHRAFTPVIFAEGGLEAARYLVEQSACRLYSMDNLLKL